MRIALIGVSGFGDIHFKDVIREVEAGNATAAAACIINPEEVPEKVARLQSLGCRVYPDVEALFAAETGRLDLVMIPTGIATHRPFTERALAAGANVLVEKPAAATLADVDAMMAAETRSARRVFVGFQQRYDPLARVLQSRLLAGELGAVHEIRGMGSWPRGFSYYRRNAWAGKLRLGSEPVNDAPFNNAFAHYLLAALWLASPSAGRAAEPLQVEADLYRAYDIETCDSALLRIRTDGAPVLLAFTHVGLEHIDPRLELFAEKGRLVITMNEAVFTFSDGRVERFPALQGEELRATMFRNIRDLLAGAPHPGPVCPLSLARAQTRAATAALAAPIHPVDPRRIRRIPTPDGLDRLVWDDVGRQVLTFPSPA